MLLSHKFIYKLSVGALAEQAMKTLRNEAVMYDLYWNEDCTAELTTLLPPEICWKIWRCAKTDQFIEKVETLARIFQPIESTDQFDDFSVIRGVSEWDGQLVIGNTIKVNNTIIAHYAEYTIGGIMQKAITFWFRGRKIYSDQWSESFRIVKCNGEIFYNIF